MLGDPSISQTSELTSVVLQADFPHLTAVQAIASVLLVFITGAYAIYTHQLVKHNQRYVEEIRRERHREAIFTLIGDAIRPLISEVEAAQTEKPVTYSAEKPGFEEIKASIDLPSNPLWSDLVSENPKLIDLYSTIDQHRTVYNRTRQELMRDCSDILEVCNDIMYRGFVDYALSEQELEAISRPTAKSYAISSLAREGEELTEENIKAATPSRIESVKNEIESWISDAPNRQEFVEQLTTETSLSGDTAEVVYDWITTGDPAMREMAEAEEDSFFFFERNIGRYLAERDSPTKLAEEMLQNEVSPSNYPYTATLQDVADFPWLVFPDDMKSLAESASQYADALLAFETELRRVEAEYMDQYAIRPIELEQQKTESE